MINLTDNLLIFFFLFTFYRGWRKGLLSMVLGPLALILATIASIIYYNQTKDFTISLLVGLVGPFALHIILKFFVNLLSKPNEEKEKNFSLDRLAGGIFSVAWNGAICFITLAVIMLFPINVSWVEKIQENIYHSRSYSLLSKLSGGKIPDVSKDITKLSDLFSNKENLDKIKDTPEFIAVFNNEKIRSIYDDEISRRQIEKKDFIGLIKNPKIQEMMKDEELIEQIIKLNGKILKTK